MLEPRPKPPGVIFELSIGVTDDGPSLVKVTLRMVSEVTVAELPFSMSLFTFSDSMLKLCSACPPFLTVTVIG